MIDDQPRPRVPGRDHHRHPAPGQMHKFTRYGGNYTTFEEMRAERMTQQAAAYGKPAGKAWRTCRSFIDRFKAKASKAKQAQSRVKALARMEKLAPVLTDSRVRASTSSEPAEPAQPDAEPCTERGMRLPQAPEAGRPAHKPIVHGTSTAPCWPASASASSAPTARANPRWSKPSPTRCSRNSPVNSWSKAKAWPLATFAQQETGSCCSERRHAAAAHGAAGARPVSPNAREQELRNFLGQFRFTGRHGPPDQVGTLSGGERARLVMASHRLAAPQPAAAGRAHQPPGPEHARGVVHRAERV